MMSLLCIIVLFFVHHFVRCRLFICEFEDEYCRVVYEPAPAESKSSSVVSTPSMTLRLAETAKGLV